MRGGGEKDMGASDQKIPLMPIEQRVVTKAR
jgi:hypothetical protein